MAFRARKLRQAGVEAVLQVFEGQSHAQYYRDDTAPESREAFKKIAGFFDKHLGAMTESTMGRTSCAMIHLRPHLRSPRCPAVVCSLATRQRRNFPQSRRSDRSSQASVTINFRSASIAARSP